MHGAAIGFQRQNRTILSFAHSSWFTSWNQWIFFFHSYLSYFHFSFIFYCLLFIFFHCKKFHSILASSLSINQLYFSLVLSAVVITIPTMWSGFIVALHTGMRIPRGWKCATLVLIERLQCRIMTRRR